MEEDYTDMEWYSVPLIVVLVGVVLYIINVVESAIKELQYRDKCNKKHWR